MCPPPMDEDQAIASQLTGQRFRLNGSTERYDRLQAASGICRSPIMANLQRKSIDMKASQNRFAEPRRPR